MLVSSHYIREREREIRRHADNDIYNSMNRGSHIDKWILHHTTIEYPVIVLHNIGKIIILSTIW